MDEELINLMEKTNEITRKYGGNNGNSGGSSGGSGAMGFEPSPTKPIGFEQAVSVLK